MKIRRRMSLAAVSSAALFALAACAGGNAIPPASSLPPSGPPDSATVGFTIRIPNPVRPHRRAPRYISASTKSIAIAIKTSGGTTAATVDANLTPTTGGCSAAGGGTVCRLTVKVAPGRYTALIDTYDAIDQGGRILSEGYNLPMTIVAGKANSVALTLGGVPHSFTISGGSTSIKGSQALGFTLYGKTAQPFAIVAKDADNNAIVGSKALQYTASVQTGTGWSVPAAPNPASPNTLSVTPPGATGSAATFKIAFGLSAAACAQAGSICSVTFNVKNDVQKLFVVDCEKTCLTSSKDDAVEVFDPPYTGAVATSITNGILNPQSVAVDGSGQLFVANCGTSCAGGGADSVTVYAPPYTGAPTHTITTGISAPFQVVANKAGYVFVLSSSNVITAYAPPTYSSAVTVTTGMAQIDAMGTNASGDLFVVACKTTCGYAGSDAVLQFSSPYSGAATNTITSGFSASNTIPSGIGFDSSGNLFVGTCAACGTTPSYSVVEYTSPYTGWPAHTITGSGAGAVNTPMSLVLDSSNNLFVGNGPNAMNSVISKFTPAAYGNSGTTFLSGYQPYQMTIDAMNDIFLADGDSVQVSAPPYSALTQVKVSGTAGMTNVPMAISP